MFKGSQPTDGGNLLLSDPEKEELLKIEPQAAQFVKPIISAREFLHNERRWCLWLINVDPKELKKCTNVLIRIQAVRDFRLKSKKAATVKWAKKPSLFTENRQPESDYILFPRHSSENRNYIPIGFFSKDFIIADSCNSVPDVNLFHFGVLTSEMHMTWVRYVCGRIKSDFRYSNDIVYNNFPWPEVPSNKHIKSVETKTQKVLDVREEFPNSCLADLYNPLTMPPTLVKVHQELDKAVDLCYRPQPFPNETKRIEFLFELYEKYTQPLISKPKKSKKN